MIAVRRGEDLTPKYRIPVATKFTPAIRRSIGQLLSQNPRNSSYWLAARLTEREGKQFSARGVSLTLKKMGYHNGEPKRYLLSPKNKLERLNFANANLHTNWDRLWSFDESYFNINPGSGQVWYHRGVFRRVARRKLTNKQETISICIVVANSHNFKSKLCYLSKGWKPAELINVLDLDLLPSIQWDHNRRQFRALLLDNDGRHHNAGVKTYLEENGLDTIGFLPPNSPDINPVENVFGLMKRFVRNRAPTTEPQLRQAVIDAWDSLTIDTLRNLFASLPERMQQVVAVHGDRIEY